jgi:energy-coupling factor transporter transmembrane protein EcfT
MDELRNRLGYEYRDTFIHNLHPYAKIVFVNALAAIGLTYLDIRFLIPLLAIAVYVYQKTEVPIDWIKTFFKVWLIMTMNPVSLFWTIFMASPKFYKVLPQDFVSTVVLQVTPPGTPIFGYTAITYGTIYYWIARRLQTPITFMMAAVLVYTLNMSDLAQSLAGTGLPSHFLFMITGGYRFVSVFAKMITNTQNAIKLRGWEVKTKNPLKIVTLGMPFAMSIARRFPGAVHNVSLQMEIRAFASHRKIPRWRHMSLTLFEIILIVCSILVVATAQYLLFKYDIGMI